MQATNRNILFLLLKKRAATPEPHAFHYLICAVRSGGRKLVVELDLLHGLKIALRMNQQPRCVRGC